MLHNHHLILLKVILICFDWKGDFYMNKDTERRAVFICTMSELVCQISPNIEHITNTL